MNTFGQAPSSDQEAPATLQRIAELLPALGYSMSGSNEGGLYLDLPSCRACIRQAHTHIEIIGGAQQEDGDYEHAFSWAENFHADNFMPTMFPTVNQATGEVHLFGSFRIPTAWGYTDTQLTEQVGIGLDAVAKAIDGYRKG